MTNAVLLASAITSNGNLNLTTSNAGITFNNSSATVNSTLNDYETGTWTPVDNSGAGLTLTTVSASYTKIGRLVYVWAYVNYPVTANTATVQISGLPFQQGPVSTYANGTSRSANISTLLQAQVGSVSTYLNLYNGGGTNVTNVNLSNSYLVFNIVYQANF